MSPFRIPLMAMLLTSSAIAAAPAQPVQYWDGPNLAPNGVVDGGSGMWNAEATNWTNEAGTLNTGWGSGTAVFKGTPGNIILTFPITIVGMRFEVDGYNISGLFFDNTPGDLDINVSANATAAIASIIGGSEALIKNGDGTLILGGAANFYMGDTILNGGVTRIFNDAALGLGANIIFNGGTLETGNTFSTSRNIMLESGGGNFSPVNGTAITINGVISGSGGLTFGGEAGTTILGGNNTYTGGTVINGGIVRTNSSQAFGTGGLEMNDGELNLGANLDVASLSGRGGRIDLAGGDLNVNQTSDERFGGDILGSGGITKRGGGTLELTGANSYTGGTTIAGGTLAGTLDSIPGDVLNNGTLEFRDEENGVLNNKISGSGDVVFAGTGLIEITKNQTYTGKTTIRGGTVLVNADLASDEVIIGEDAMIGGSGVLKGDLNNMGTLSPGNSPGTLRINGDLTYAGGARTQIEVASRSDFDRIIVRRTARLNGELQVLLLGGFEPDQGDTFEIITARRVIGRFSSEDLPASAQFDVVYNPGSVELVAAGRIPYQFFARTQNQFNTAVALETLRTRDLGTGTDFNRNVRTVLDILPAPALRSAFEQITPSQSVAFAQSAFAISRVWLPQMATRLAEIRAGSRGFVAHGFNERGASDMKDVLAPVAENRWGVWVDGSGVFSETPSFNGLRTGDASSAQATVGVDYRLNDNFTVGFYTGYIGTWTNFGGGSSVDSNGSRFGIYSTYQTGGFYLNSVVGGEWNAYDWNRSIRFPGIDRRTSADTEGTVFETMFGGGYDWKLSECLSIGAFTSLEYTLLNVDGFTESGARSLDLRINDQDADSLRTNLGMQVAGSIPIGTKFLRPSVRAAWRHEYLDGSRNITSSLAGGTGPAFTTNLPGGNRSDSLLINGGVSMDLIDNVTGYLYYTGDIAGTATENIHAINAGLRVTF